MITINENITTDTENLYCDNCENVLEYCECIIEDDHIENDSEFCEDCDFYVNNCQCFYCEGCDEVEHYCECEF